jgi:hypothetical protein
VIRGLPIISVIKGATPHKDCENDHSGKVVPVWMLERSKLRGTFSRPSRTQDRCWNRCQMSLQFTSCIVLIIMCRPMTHNCKNRIGRRLHLRTTKTTVSRKVPFRLAGNVNKFDFHVCQEENHCNLCICFD